MVHTGGGIYHSGCRIREVNPIPVKYAMNVLGWEAGECRLPLVEPSEAHKEYIEKALRAEGLITE